MKKLIRKKYNAYKQWLEPHVTYRKFKKAIKQVAKMRNEPVRITLTAITSEYINSLSKLNTKKENDVYPLIVVVLVIIALSLLTAYLLN